MIAHNRTERGQALVILVFALVGLLAFAALGIDGGMVYTARRNAQNASDAASLAAALVLVDSDTGNDSTFDDVALASALVNGYEEDANQSKVTIHRPPITGTFVGDDDYIQVFITTTLSTAFAHFIYSGELQTTVEAVSRIIPAGPLYEGNALVALSPDDCRAMDFNGAQGTFIFGGGVFSNSTANGSPTNCDAGFQNGSGEVNVTGGGINTVGTFGQVGSGAVDPAPVENNLQVVPLTVPAPNCSLLGASQGNQTIAGNSDVTLDPGQYGRVKMTSSNASLTLNPGLYCVTEFEITGGTLIGTGVTIYVTSDEFKVVGASSVNMSAPNIGGTGVPPAIPGMLIYMAEGNDSGVELAGNALTVYTGTIFSPDGPIKIVGTEDTFALSSQLIGYTVDIGGNGFVNITFDANDVYQAPAHIELAR